MRSHDRLAIMWRFARQVTPSIARDKADKAAAALGGRNLGFMLPLPGHGVSRILFSPNTLCVPTQFDKQGNQDKALEDLFTNAAMAKPMPISWLKEDLIQDGVATLLKGRPKKESPSSHAILPRRSRAPESSMTVRQSKGLAPSSSARLKTRETWFWPACGLRVPT